MYACAARLQPREPIGVRVPQYITAPRQPRWPSSIADTLNVAPICKPLIVEAFFYVHHFLSNCRNGALPSGTACCYVTLAICIVMRLAPGSCEFLGYKRP